MQFAGPESANTLKPALENHYVEMEMVRDMGKGKELIKDCRVYAYEVHDYSMLHKLIGHTHWGGNNCPFPLCKCNKKDSLAKGHICEWVTQDKYKECVKKSVNYYNTNPKIQSENDESKRMKLLNEWAAKSNFGIDHFGIDPEHFHLSEI